MPSCVNPHCRFALDDGWAFCPKCGEDNRRPDRRTPLLDCEHQIENGEFCVLCGHSIIEEGEEDSLPGIVREAMGWLCLIAGIVFVFIGQRLTHDSRGLSYLLGRYGFLLIPTGIFFILSSPVRWRIFKRR